MARYNRINLDGKSITRTALLKSNAKAGDILTIDGNELVAVTAYDGSQQLYAVNTAYTQGLNVEDEIKAGLTVVADIVEPSRSLALKVSTAGNIKLGSPLKLTGSGVELAGASDIVIGFSNEDLKAVAGDLLSVRIK